MRSLIISALLLAAIASSDCARADAPTTTLNGKEKHVTNHAVVQNVIADKVKSFAYGDVQLRPGLFEQRFLLNRDYLLCLSNDSLLYLYRKQAGLPTPGKPYGGWCTVEGTQWPHNGEFQCDYLSALARSYVECGDERLKAQADEFVAGLAACQQPNGAIYAGAVSEDRIFYYTMDKWLKGLDAAHRCLGNQEG